MKKILSSKQEADRRYKLCKDCKNFRKLTRTCSICNCIMYAKTKLENAECPIGKWGNNNSWG